MPGPTTDTPSTQEAILTLRTSVWAWIFLAAMLAGGIFIIAHEFQTAQPPSISAILIGAGACLVFSICALISSRHRIHIYEDCIISRTILGTRIVMLEEITRIEKSLDFINLYTNDKRLLIIPSSLKNFFKLNKLLKKICPNIS